jgi:hypothetical protein
MPAELEEIEIDTTFRPPPFEPELSISTIHLHNKKRVAIFIATLANVEYLK